MDIKEIRIEELNSIADYRACEELQQRVWQSEPRDVVPLHVLITSQRHGGLALGAFDANRNMIGCLFGFPGQVAEGNPAAGGTRWQHCSHLAGVAPEWRGRGVGYQLKLAQREWALRQGYEVITWTYDPLEAPNAMLNLGKLGAVCRCYLRSFYGEMSDGLNAGLPSDRFEVAWWIDSPRVRKRVEQGWLSPQIDSLLKQGAMVANEAAPRRDGLLEPRAVKPLNGERALVEMPAQFQAIKSADLGLALAWRLNLREACEAAFGAGYTCTDVVRAGDNGGRRLYYLLEQTPMA